jgi:hypothetical protein
MAVIYIHTREWLLSFLCNHILKFFKKEKYEQEEERKKERSLYNMALDTLLPYGHAIQWKAAPAAARRGSRCNNSKFRYVVGVMGRVDGWMDGGDF